MITIRSSKDIKKILNSGSVIKKSNFILIYRKNNSEFPRFAFIASKKFSKRAVDRNRAKRLLREAVRKRIDKLSKFHYDFIFIAKKNILNKKLQDVLKEIDDIILEIR